MRPGKKEDENVKAQYKNTRSKFYHKQASFDKDDSKNENAFNPFSKGGNNGNQSTGGFSGGHWKQQGNDHFKAKNYSKAIQCYTKAIQVNPGESQYYSNRSKCYQKQGNLNLALKDAQAACELNEDNIKAHYICGCILAELGKNDESKLFKSENRLKKALRLCTTLSTPQFSEEISIKIFRLKKLIWFKQHQKQLGAIEVEKDVIRKAYDKYQIAKPQFDMLWSMLESRAERLKEPHQIPDQLVCKITLELMEDPVVSEAGYTYERKALEEHYKMKGPVEPINRKECKGFIIPNLALKITIEQFLNDHPWGFEIQDKEDYRSFLMI